MRIRTLIVAALLALVPASAAVALKRHYRVTPTNMTEVVVEVAHPGEGEGEGEGEQRYAFTIRRDLAKVRWRSGRSATLHVYDTNGLVARFPVAGETADGWLVYRFDLSPAHVEHSSFVLDEYQTDDTAEDELREMLIGGGTFYDVRLRDFLAKPVVDDALEDTPLARAIARFNADASAHPTGRDQPPLTLAEVRAAIRWWAFHRADAPVPDDDFLAFLAIAETGELPPGAEFEILTSFQPSPEFEFRAWSVRIRVPRAVGDGSSFAYTIRERMLESRRVGR